MRLIALPMIVRGNLIRKIDKATGEVEAFTYDHRQRLIVATRSSSSGVLLSRVVNRYDVFNRRIARSEDADGLGRALQRLPILFTLVRTRGLITMPLASW